MTRRTGGCLCRQIRYACRGEPYSVAYCHCTKCRLAAGAVAVAWATFPVDAVYVLFGRVASYRSSPEGERTFCANCGTQLFFSSRMSTDEIDVTLGSLDEPMTLQPTCHLWATTMLPWLHCLGSLPWHPEESRIPAFKELRAEALPIELASRVSRI